MAQVNLRMPDSTKWTPPPAMYGLDFGKMVHDYIMQSEFTLTEIAERMGLTKTGFHQKCKSPVFGSIYDLIKISIILDKDFVSPAIMAIKNKGVPVDRVYSDKEVADLNSKVYKMERTIDNMAREREMLYDNILKMKGSDRE